LHRAGVTTNGVGQRKSAAWVKWSSAHTTALMRRHGDRILRFKGVIPLAQADHALVLQSVRHRVSAPEHLELAPGSDGSGFGLVFICDGDYETRIRTSLEKFGALAQRSVAL